MGHLGDEVDLLLLRDLIQAADRVTTDLLFQTGDRARRELWEMSFRNG